MQRPVLVLAERPGEVAEMQISKPKVCAACRFPVERKIKAGFDLCAHDGFTGSEPNCFEVCGYQIGFGIPV